MYSGGSFYPGYGAPPPPGAHYRSPPPGTTVVAAPPGATVVPGQAPVPVAPGTAAAYHVGHAVHYQAPPIAVSQYKGTHYVAGPTTAPAAATYPTGYNVYPPASGKTVYYTQQPPPPQYIPTTSPDKRERKAIPIVNPDSSSQPSVANSYTVTQVTTVSTSAAYKTLHGMSFPPNAPKAEIRALDIVDPNVTSQDSQSTVSSDDVCDIPLPSDSDTSQETIDPQPTVKSTNFWDTKSEEYPSHPPRPREFGDVSVSVWSNLDAASSDGGSTITSVAPMSSGPMADNEQEIGQNESQSEEDLIDSIYWKFGKIVKEQGEIKSTDYKILQIFVGLPQEERRIVMTKGNVGSFLAGCPYIDYNTTNRALSISQNVAETLMSAEPFEGYLGGYNNERLMKRPSSAMSGDSDKTLEHTEIEENSVLEKLEKSIDDKDYKNELPEQYDEDSDRFKDEVLFHEARERQGSASSENSESQDMVDSSKPGLNGIDSEGRPAESGKNTIPSHKLILDSVNAKTLNINSAVFTPDQYSSQSSQDTVTSTSQVYVTSVTSPTRSPGLNANSVEFNPISSQNALKSPLADVIHAAPFVPTQSPTSVRAMRAPVRFRTSPLSAGSAEFRPRSIVSVKVRPQMTPAFTQTSLSTLDKAISVAIADASHPDTQVGTSTSPCTGDCSATNWKILYQEADESSRMYKQKYEEAIQRAERAEKIYANIVACLGLSPNSVPGLEPPKPTTTTAAEHYQITSTDHQVTTSAAEDKTKTIPTSVDSTENYVQGSMVPSGVSNKVSLWKSSDYANQQSTTSATGDRTESIQTSEHHVQSSLVPSSSGNKVSVWKSSDYDNMAQYEKDVDVQQTVESSKARDITLHSNISSDASFYSSLDNTVEEVTVDNNNYKVKDTSEDNIVKQEVNKQETSTDSLNKLNVKVCDLEKQNISNKVSSKFPEAETKDSDIKCNSQIKTEESPKKNLDGKESRISPERDAKSSSIKLEDVWPCLKRSNSSESNHVSPPKQTVSAVSKNGDVTRSKISDVAKTKDVLSPESVKQEEKGGGNKTVNNSQDASIFDDLKDASIFDDLKDASIFDDLKDASSHVLKTKLEQTCKANDIDTVNAAESCDKVMEKETPSSWEEREAAGMEQSADQSNELNEALLETEKVEKELTEETSTSEPIQRGVSHINNDTPDQASLQPEPESVNVKTEQAPLTGAVTNCEQPIPRESPAPDEDPAIVAHRLSPPSDSFTETLPPSTNDPMPNAATGSTSDLESTAAMDPMAAVLTMGSSENNVDSSAQLGAMVPPTGAVPNIDLVTYGPLLEQMMISLVQVNPTLAGNQQLLQLMATQHLIAMIGQTPSLHEQPQSPSQTTVPPQPVTPPTHVLTTGTESPQPITQTTEPAKEEKRIKRKKKSVRKEDDATSKDIDTNKIRTRATSETSDTITTDKLTTSHTNKTVASMMQEEFTPTSAVSRPPGTAPSLAPTISRQPVVAPTASRQPVVAPTASRQPVVAPTASRQPVVAPTASRQPVIAPTASRQSVTAPTTNRQPIINPFVPKPPVITPLMPVDTPTGRQPVIAPTASRQPVRAPTASRQPISAPTTTRQPVMNPYVPKPPIITPLMSVDTPAGRQPIIDPTASRQPVFNPTATRQPVMNPTAMRQPVFNPTASRQPVMNPTAARQPVSNPTSSWQAVTGSRKPVVNPVVESEPMNDKANEDWDDESDPYSTYKEAWTISDALYKEPNLEGIVKPVYEKVAEEVAVKRVTAPNIFEEPLISNIKGGAKPKATTASSKPVTSHDFYPNFTASKPAFSNNDFPALAPSSNSGPLINGNTGANNMKLKSAEFPSLPSSGKGIASIVPKTSPVKAVSKKPVAPVPVQSAKYIPGLTEKPPGKTLPASATAPKAKVAKHIGPVIMPPRLRAKRAGNISKLFKDAIGGIKTAKSGSSNSKVDPATSNSNVKVIKEEDEVWTEVKKTSKKGKAGTVASDNKEQKKADKKAENFDRLVQTLQENFPSIPRTMLLDVIQEIRNKFGGLKNRSMAQIVDEAKKVVAQGKFKIKFTKLGGKASTAIPGDKSIVSSTDPEAMSEHNPLYKTQSCNYYDKNGSCPNGKTCVFAHGSHELRQLKNVLNKTLICEFWLQGTCRKGSKCVYAHGEHELKPFQKSILCGQFSKTGSCPYGRKCIYAHSTSEIRKGPTPPPVSYKENPGYAEASKQSVYDIVLSSDDEDGMECAICYSYIRDQTEEQKLDCGHIFHDACIKQWIASERSCPMCRAYTLLDDEFPALA